jgi:ABC-2 type transport system permease protein/oleandomycin transport system permease protein
MSVAIGVPTPRAVALTNAATITWRNLMGFVRVPQSIFFASLQPTMFVLIFNYVFGGAISRSLPPGVGYLDYLMPGVFVMTLAFGTILTAIGLAEDLNTGIIERFRTLPMARSAVLSGRTGADLCRSLYVLGWLTALGYALGFRVHQGLLGFLAATLLTLTFTFALSWVLCLVGLLAPSGESANLMSFPILFPLAFVSSGLLPISTMPGWLQVFAAHQPVTYTVNAVRALILGGPAATAVIGSLVWSAGILVVFAPLAIWRYRRAAFG